MTGHNAAAAGSSLMRRAACLGVLGVMLLGLYAYPGSAGQDPYHAHIVVGGTPAGRARALVFHILHEREGIDDAELPMALGTGWTGLAGVRVVSIRRNDGDGAAVLNTQTSGAVLLAAIPQVPAPSQSAWTMASPPSGAPQTALPTPDPPPRSL